MILASKIEEALVKWDEQNTVGSTSREELAEFLEAELEMPKRIDSAEHHIVGTPLEPIKVHYVAIRIEELPHMHRAIRIGGHSGGVDLLLAPWQEVIWHMPQRSDQPAWSRGSRLAGDVDLMSITLKSFSRGG